ncbi:hypothetical protein BX070DRAFT_228728 [Coemansia spiralis]|nr:hypothetical protein BX070DRAFT_228728 [Coemansia spiralis]
MLAFYLPCFFTVLYALSRIKGMEALGHPPLYTTGSRSLYIQHPLILLGFISLLAKFGPSYFYADLVSSSLLTSQNILIPLKKSFRLPPSTAVTLKSKKKTPLAMLLYCRFNFSPLLLFSPFYYAFIVIYALFKVHTAAQTIISTQQSAPSEILNSC